MNEISWELEIASQYEINFDVKFTNPLYVSQDTNNLDQLEIEVTDLFFDEILGFENTHPVFFTREIPPQVDEDLADTIETVVESAVQSVQFYFATDLVFSIFFGGLLSLLWGLINSLQMIVMTVLFTVLMPTNANDVL